MPSSMTELDVVNRALIKLGANKITSLTQDVQSARIMSNIVDPVRDKFLRSNSWNPSIERKVIAADSTPPAWGFTTQYMLPHDFIKMITVEAGSSTTTLGTAVSRTTTTNDGTVAGLINGKRYYLSNPVPATGYGTDDPTNAYFRVVGGKFVTDAYASASFGQTFTADVQLEQVSVSGSANTVDSGGFPNPIEYRIEGDYIHCDQAESIQIKYVKRLTDMSRYDPHMIEALATLYASEACMALTGDMNLRRVLMEEYRVQCIEAKKHDGWEDSPSDFRYDEWLEARFNG